MSNLIKVYISSGYPNRFMLSLLNEYLEDELNIEIVSSWILYGEEDVSFKSAVLSDIDEIKKSDLILGFWPGSFGTMCELSFSIGLGKPIIFCIPPELELTSESHDRSRFSTQFPFPLLTKWENGYPLDDSSISSNQDALQFIVNTPREMWDCICHVIEKIEKQRREKCEN